MFKNRAKKLVDSQDFFDSLVEEIQSMKTPENRFKAWLELVTFVAPKVKAEDPLVDSNPPSIEIKYTVNNAPDS